MIKVGAIGRSFANRSLRSYSASQSFSLSGRKERTEVSERKRYNGFVTRSSRCFSSTKIATASSQQQQQQPLQQHVDSTFGFLKRRRVDVCITPGLTVAYDTSCEKEDLPPTLRHTKLDTTFVACTGENHYRAKCLHRMYDDDQAASLRARTLTSTGMKDVVVPVIDLLKPSTAKKKKKQRKETKQQTQQRRPDDQDQLWEQMEQEFGVSKQFMSATRRMLLEQTTDIAAENLLGQCTKDHSCKSKAQEQLKSVANGGA